MSWPLRGGCLSCPFLSPALTGLALALLPRMALVPSAVCAFRSDTLPSVLHPKWKLEVSGLLKHKENIS